MKIFVKNMACESCKAFVREALNELHISPIKVELGEIETKKDVTDEDKILLNKKNKEVGLELLEKKQGVLIERIRKVMVDYVYKSDDKPNVNFSVLLSEELDMSYTYLANFFSEVEATTIEQFIISLKIERIKELIIFQKAGKLVKTSDIFNINQGALLGIKNIFKIPTSGEKVKKFHQQQN